jgi:hypothetical protein
MFAASLQRGLAGSHAAPVVVGRCCLAISSASGASSAVAWCSDDKKKPLTEFKLPDGFPKLPDGIALPFALPELTKEAALPMATSVGFGTLTGFSCGYSLKKVGRAAAGVFGGLFVLFQVRKRGPHGSWRLCAHLGR